MNNSIHIVSAWANSNQLVLGQIKTSEKSNEITAIPELLNLPDIEECIITIDAMGNQGYLKEEVQNTFLRQQPYSTVETVEKGHGKQSDKLQ